MPYFPDDRIWEILHSVKDPEIPVVSLVEMGIVRGFEWDENTLRVTLTPTFSGCPALHAMTNETRIALEEAGIPRVEIVISHTPPWSSDHISAEGRRKLKEFGLAPPPMLNGLLSLDALDIVRCPHCDSPDTELKNPFGATLCRALYVCKNCLEPFEQFKPI